MRVLAAARGANFVARDLAFERVAPASGNERLILKVGGEAPLTDAVQFFEVVLGDAADAPAAPARVVLAAARAGDRSGAPRRAAAVRRSASELRVGFEPVGDDRRAAPKGVPK